ncbi:MAG: hypothetical protein IAF38_19025, partial [Bacteroidia bacterium]|nr:hypothetical protein [Bacteroidia bacterium]
MKTFLLSAFIGLFILSASAQLNPAAIEKICIEGDVSNLLHIKYIDNMLLAKVDYPVSLAGLDAITGRQIWSKPYKTEYGIHTYGNDVIISKNVNTFDDKTKKTTKREWLYTLNAKTGAMKDSVLLKFAVVYLSSSKGLTENTAMIIQSAEDKFKSVIVNKKTGLIAFTLFAEAAGAYDIPLAIQVDPADKYVAIGCANGAKGFFLYDFKTGKQLMNLAGKGDITNIVFTSDSKYCTYIQAKKLKIINVSTLKPEKEIATENAAAHVTIHSDNENVVLSGYSVNVPLKFINWKTGASSVSAINVRGGVPVFTNEGNLYLPLQGGVQCAVAKDKLPYLAKVTFTNSTQTSTNSTTTTSSANTNSASGTFKAGSRAYILYTGDNKYYSGVISEVTSSGFSVIYDDCTRATVNTNQVKALPPIKISNIVQARRPDKKFYNCVVKDVSGELVKVE